MQHRPYHRLIAWQESHNLCQKIYALTAMFPTREQYGLTQQMRRSAYGIPMNVVEGNARRSKNEFRHFIDIAIGSLEELHYQCVLAESLGYVDGEELQKIDENIHRVSYLLTALRKSLTKSF